MMESDSAYLASAKSTGEETIYPVISGTVIGRDEQTADLALQDKSISRIHCKIEHSQDGWFIEDLKSTNGVFVGGHKITGQSQLQDGDLIGLGNPEITLFRFVIREPKAGQIHYQLPQRDDYSIGRSIGADIAIPSDLSISARHALLSNTAQGPVLRDLGSSNGTWINGKRINRSPVSPHDIITLGKTALRLQPLADGGLDVTQGNLNTSINLQCIDLEQQVGGPAGKKILQAISLHIKRGEFVGILGPSGAGKTTLLKTLNGYRKPTHGAVYVNASDLYHSYDMFRKVIGYVPQDDIVYPELRVRDSLKYITRLRLPGDLTDEIRAVRVQDILQKINLDHVDSNRILSLSGGQRKRVSVAAELITKPSLLFLDEPTSGLDPSTEERLMNHLKGLSREQGTTILITTHILYNLDLLDRVIILARGRLCYFGKPDGALDYFSEGRQQPLTRPTQIFDLLEGIDTENAQTREHKANHLEDIAETYAKRYRQSPLYREHILDKLEDNTRNRDQRTRAGIDAAKPGRKQASSPRWSIFSPRTIWTMVQRHFAIKLSSRRNLLIYLLVPLVLGLVTLSMSVPEPFTAQEAIDHRSQVDQVIQQGGRAVEPVLKQLFIACEDGQTNCAQNDPRPGGEIVYGLQKQTILNIPIPVSVLLMYVMMATFTGTLMACMEISSERPLLRREFMAGLNINDYLLSKLPFLFSLTTCQTAVFLMLCFLKPELRDVNLLNTFLSLTAVAWAACTVGLLVSAADPTRGQLSVVLAVVAVLPQLVLSGGLGPDYYGGMEWYMQRVADILPSRWGFEMLLTSAFDQPGRSHYAWIGNLVRDDIGFRFGNVVFWRNTLLLLAQAIMMLTLTRWLIVRRFAQ